VIAYFDLFNYPVSVEDILFFLDREVEESSIRKEIDALLVEGCLFRTGHYLSLRNDPSLAEKRNRGRQHAEELLPIAHKGARLLFQFPFVRSVCISGSLSKRCADENADIDYFIITRAGRLWIARTLMHLFKKLTYLRGRQHRYCMNYFVDEDAMEIREKNIFTATELITLMPASGNTVTAKFFRANEWTCAYYPNYSHRNREAPETPEPSWLKRWCEKLLDNRLGDRLDNYLRGVTDRRWKKKEQKGRLNMKGNRMTLQCTKHYSRPNPETFQQMVVNRYHSKLKDLTARWAARTDEEAISSGRK
jgi:hypothetical protein